jgi:uncharacterized membrane protein YeaQ/YmgE (transglycosylase-associated protein family)
VAVDHASAERKDPDLTMWAILAFIVFGLVTGWLASVFVRGEKHPSDWGPLLIVGVVGSLLGGTIVNLLMGNGLRPAVGGFIASVAGACLLLFLITRLQDRTKKKRRSGGDGRRQRS